MEENVTRGEISDKAVLAATGKALGEWYVILDEAGGRTMEHKAIAEYLTNERGVSGWWSQSVAGAYERARGLRERHQMADGYQVSVGRVVNVPVGRLYQAWQDENLRRAWLGGHTYAVSSAREDKSIRGVWEDGNRFAATFYDKGPNKSQITVEQRKLPDADFAAARKTFWSEALDALKKEVEAS